MLKRSCNRCYALFMNSKLEYWCDLGFSIDQSKKSEEPKPLTECPKPRTQQAYDKLRLGLKK